MNKKLKPVMFVGTGSDVGKSIINAGFCRIFLQDGYSPAPFKAQNMSLNSYATPEGLEIGRAQAVQAEACRIDCSVHMNPVLLKPQTDQRAQIVLKGRPVGSQSAAEYFNGDRTPLFNEAKSSFDYLNREFNPVVMEGAGSISELNLRNRDITNMRIAAYADAAVYLVADIDRGGVMGSVYGTLKLQPPEDAALIKGVIINKFRGDISLFDDGRKMLEDLTGVPVVGVVPWFRDIYIEEEDSVQLDNKKTSAISNKINVAVVLLKRMSNFTDFNVLERDSRVNLFYTANAEELKKADIIILPGSKCTIADLMDLRSEGLASVIIEARENGKSVIGVCGGYQMMGSEIADPDHIEGNVEAVPGLNLLPVRTVIKSKKHTVQQQFFFLDKKEVCNGYEIHMGETELDGGEPLNKLTNGRVEGCYLDSRCWGSYMHGIFDNSSVLDGMLQPCGGKESESFDYASFRDKQYDLLADHLRKSVDMEQIYRELQVK